MRLINKILIIFLSFILFIFLNGVNYTFHFCSTCKKTESSIDIFSNSNFDNCNHNSNHFVTKTNHQCCSNPFKNNSSIVNKCCVFKNLFLKIDNINNQDFVKIYVSIFLIKFYDIEDYFYNIKIIFRNFFENKSPPFKKIYLFFSVLRN